MESMSNRALMVRQGCATRQNVRSRPPEEGRGVLAGGDHHQVIDQGEPVPAARCSEGPGKDRSSASEALRAPWAGNGRGCRCLFGTPGILEGSGVLRGELPGCDHGVANQPALAVQIERQRHFLPPGLAEGKRRSCCVGHAVENRVDGWNPSHNPKV